MNGIVKLLSPPALARPNEWAIAGVLKLWRKFKFMKFRKKPVVIEAMSLTIATWEECLIFIGDENIMDRTSMDECFIEIRTLEGNIGARANDWIIKGVAGEFYPCKPDIFEKTYEPV
jgi:hypothetical protein